MRSWSPRPRPRFIPTIASGSPARLSFSARGWSRGRPAAASCGRRGCGTRRCSPGSSSTARSCDRRIDARVDAMLAAGATLEVRRAEAAGASRTARSAIGFEELLAGDVDAMKLAQRRYARRQLTWMRKMPGVTLDDCTGRTDGDVAAEIVPLLR